MYIIIATVIGSLIFFFWSTFQSIIIVINKSIPQAALIWFWSILFINCILYVFVAWYRRLKLETPGPVGKKGYPGPSR